MTEFFEEFLFGKPMNLIYNAGNTKDMNPAYWVKTDKGYKATCRTVGIEPEAVKVKIDEYKIIVEGESEYENTKYDTYFELPIAKVIMNDIVAIDYKTLNGLTYIYLTITNPEPKYIQINKMI